MYGSESMNEYKEYIDIDTLKQIKRILEKGKMTKDEEYWHIVSVLEAWEKIEKLRKNKSKRR